MIALPDRIANLFGKEKGAALAGSPVATSVPQQKEECMTFNDDSSGNGNGKRAPTVSGHAFAKKLRWTIKNPPKDAERWTIAPEMADAMLEWNDRNRPITQSKVSDYAALMAAGRWPYTGETINFSKKRLLNGQHRLLACVKSGACFEALVAFDIPDDSFAFMDIGKKRTAGDIFAINGVQNAALMAAAVGWVIGYDSNTIRTAATAPTKRADLAALYAEYCKHERLQESAWVGHLFHGNRLAAPSTVVAFHYICARKSRKDADEFFRRVGEGLGFSGKSDPGYRLHKKLSANAISQEKLTRIQVAAFIVKAWNAHRRNQDVGVLRFNMDEVFPKVI